MEHTLDGSIQEIHRHRLLCALFVATSLVLGLIVIVCR